MNAQPSTHASPPPSQPDCAVSLTTRRTFFRALGKGLLVLIVGNSLHAQERGGRQRRSGGFRGGNRPSDVSAWIHIGENGTITVFTGKTEVGQNIRTSLTQAVAEELHAPIDSIQMVMADTDLTPFDGGTAGSRTTPDMAAHLHRAAAAAREALLDLAAAHFKADRTSLTVGSGKISHGVSGESVAFAQLTKGEKLIKTITEQDHATPAAEWKIAGTSVPKVNGRDFVTGKHQYASDISRPGMLHGKVLRPPAAGSTLVSVDTQAAESMPGVTVVHEGEFVGVTAPDLLTAERAIHSMQAQWKTDPQPSHRELFALLKPNGPPPTLPDPPEGEHRLQRTYTVAYIAHAPLEPRAAVADWANGKATVWAGTQRPFGVRGDIAQALGLQDSNVRVIVPDTGSGYGGKHNNAAATEAARLSKATGKPVKVVWTREEEFQWAYFRPAGVIDISSSVRPDGTIHSWEAHNYNSGGSALSSPYDIPGQRTQTHQSRAPLKQGSYRALASTANTFAREMHMDELARLVKLDPLEFRLRNLKSPRLRAVLEAAATAFNWAKHQAQDGHGIGLACGTEKNSFVATCVELAADRTQGKIQLLRIVTAFECGAIVNPEHLKNQIEGATVMGIGGALFEAIEFDGGKILNPRFSKYRVPRFSDTCPMETVLLNRKDLPSSGAGETPIIGIAPAIGNAIFNATGVRLNSLPMIPDGLKA